MVHMSSMVKVTSSNGNSSSHDNNRDHLNLFNNTTNSPTTDAAGNLSVSPETFLEAAIALKQQVLCSFYQNSVESSLRFVIF